MKKNISCFLLGLLFSLSFVGCASNQDTAATTTEAGSMDEASTVDKEIDTSGLAEVTDETAINKAVENYTQAATKTQALKNYTVATKANAEQKSEDENFNLHSYSGMNITLDETTEGDEELSFTQLLNSNDGTEEITVYYKDGTVYTDTADYKVKTPEENYSNINPRFGDVAGALSFKSDAVEGLKSKEGDTAIYEFTLNPAKVTFSDVYTMDVTQIKSLVLVCEISDGILSNAKFTVMSESDTKTITDTNKESMESQGLSTESIETITEENAKPVTFTYTVSTMYTDVNTAKVDFPDFSEYKTQEELAAETSTETATEAK